MGGVYAVANLRGGGEYGEEWHQAGTKLQEAERLRRLHRRRRVADRQQVHVARRSWRSRGGSNGGLLVGAAMTQRPDLFGAACPPSASWTCSASTSSRSAGPGSTTTARPTTPEQFQALLAYSPLHNIKPGTQLSRHADHHRRPRRPRRPRPQLQVRRHAAGRRAKWFTAQRRRKSYPWPRLSLRLCLITWPRFSPRLCPGVSPTHPHPHRNSPPVTAPAWPWIKKIRRNNR